MNRDILAAQAEGYRKGRAEAQIEMEFVCMTREQGAFDEGREVEKRLQHRYAWGKIFLISFAAATISHFLFNLIAMIV